MNTDMECRYRTRYAYIIIVSIICLPSKIHKIGIFLLLCAGITFFHFVSFFFIFISANFSHWKQVMLISFNSSPLYQLTEQSAFIFDDKSVALFFCCFFLLFHIENAVFYLSLFFLSLLNLVSSWAHRREEKEERSMLQHQSPVVFFDQRP